MRAFRILTAVTLLSLASETGQAGGLLYHLPKDGTWVAFDYQENAERLGRRFNYKGTLYMSSVGRTTQGDDECRWIEFRFEGTRSMDGVSSSERHMYIYKLLIPEKYLNPEGKIAKNVVKCWYKSPSGDVREIKSAAERLAGRYFLVRTFFAPFPEDAEKLEKKVIKSKLGKLACEGLTGYINYGRWRGRDGGEWEGGLNVHIRLHKKAPSGVVSARMHSEMTSNGQPMFDGTFTFKLSDFGEGAESELPDHN